MRVCLHNKTRIGTYLKQQAHLNLYKIGDLDPFFWPQTQWFGWQKEALEAVALLYTGDQIPVLLLMENHAAAGELLASLAPLLPARFYAHLRPQMEHHLKGYRAIGGDTYLRMVQPDTVTSGKGQKVASNPGGAEYFTRVLAPADVSEIRAFYAEHYPQNWFNPHMLNTNNYVGLYGNHTESVDTQLLAVAGVHVFSEAESLAALGNIAVHTHFRGRGLGTRVTGALCERLRQQFGIQTLGLNVNQCNTKAQRCYEKLGFEKKAIYQEWTFEK